MNCFKREIGGKTLYVEVGKVARQANGACWIGCGDTVVLVTAVCSEEEIEGKDFFPLIVDYQEMAYAAGKIPGGFIKREGKPSDKEILCARLIDRPIRPLFPKGFMHEVQVVAKVLSADQVNPPDTLAIIGVSISLCISDIPFPGPVSAVRVGMLKGGEFVVNPTYQQLEESSIDLIVAGTNSNILMVEGGCNEISEEDVLRAIEFGQKYLLDINSMQEEISSKVGLPKRGVKEPQIDEKLEEEIRNFSISDIERANQTSGKQTRKRAMEEVFNKVIEHFSSIYPEQEEVIKTILEKIEREVVRGKILNEGIRADGRKLDELRPINCEVGTLQRTHGSSLFTRGETQALTTITLGTGEDEQIIDDIEGRSSKRFMLHYNFPPFSAGEVRPIRGPGRREIGHGNLAERALLPVIPKSQDFPYTIRIVTDILESNGSTSMATVCGGSLSLMDAGVSITQPVAGVSIGLVKEKERFALLTDITGLEDQLGDMDFKVAGTKHGITALQMDIKIDGVDLNILKLALERAKEGRLAILDEMRKVIPKHRDKLSRYAPRILTTTIDPMKIGDVIGPGGKTIKNIIGQTGVKIEIEEDGTVLIASVDEEAAAQALEMIEYLTAEVDVGKIYLGKVTRITRFGAFVEILPGKEGLLHISQLVDYRVERVEDILREGDEVLVKVINIDEQGRINLSRKAALRERNIRERKGAEKKSR